MVEGARSQGELSDCQLVVSVGDGLAADPAVASWFSGARQAEPIPETGYDGIALSPRDLDILRADQSFDMLAAVGMPFLLGDATLEDDRGGAPAARVLDCGGQRIALVGLPPSHENASWYGEDPEEVQVLRFLETASKGADIAILLSNGSPQGNLRLAERAQGLSVIVGGGTEALDPSLRPLSTGPLVLGPGFPGRSIAIAELRFADGKLIDYDWSIELFVPPS